VNTVRPLNFQRVYSRQPLLLPGMSTDGAELYMLVDFVAGQVREIRVDISELSARQLPILQEHLGDADPPYGLASLSALIPYFLAPHTFVETSDGAVVVSMKQAPYVRRLSLTGAESPTWPPADEVSFDVMLSSSNCEVAPNVVGMGAQSSADRLRRYLDPAQPIRSQVLHYDVTSGKQVEIAPLPDFVVDSFHELNYSPAGYYVGVDMNLSVDTDPAGQVAGFADGVLDVAEYGAGNAFQPSKFCVVEPDGRSVVHTPGTACAAHVDIDLLDDTVFYISCHNISKWQSQVVIHGDGRLEKYRYRDGILEELGSFTEPGFLRVTSQVPYLVDGRQFIAITSYPNQLYVIDTETMRPVHRVTLFDHEPVTTPLACPKNGLVPLYLAVSEDSRYAFLTGAAVLYVVDLRDGVVVDTAQFCEPDTFVASAHVALLRHAGV
jgi:hypothetical protein